MAGSKGGFSSGSKKLIIGVCVGAVAWLGCELVTAVIVSRNPGMVWRLGVRRPGDGPSLHGRERFHGSYVHEFDAELGWDHPPPGPARSSLSPRALVSAYGDSFTECTGPVDLTWEAQLGTALHADVINFGVGGYGPDQALLKLKRLHPRYPTPVVLFGFLSRDISRIVNIYGSARLLQETRTFLLNGTPYFMPTKPRYVLKDDQLHLLENPVKTESDFMKLVFEPGFAETFSTNDYFKSGYKLDRYYPEISFPYLVSVPQAIWVRAQVRGPIPDYAAMLMKDEQTTRLLSAILDEFVQMSKRNSFRGIIVLFGEPEELSYYLQHGKHLRLEPVVRHLQESGYAFIDTVDLLAKHGGITIPPEPISRYYDPTSHHSAYAHKIIAEGLYEYLLKQGAPMAR